MEISIRQMQCFVAVAEARNIEKAAVQMQLSTRTVVRYLYSLQESIGAPLFIYTPTDITLTPAGSIFFKSACDIIFSLAVLKDEVAAVAKSGNRRVAVGSRGSALFTHIPKIRTMFCKELPTVDFFIEDLSREQQMLALRQGRILMAFDRYIPPADDLNVELVSREEQVIAIPRMYPVSDKPSIEALDLISTPVVGSSNTSWENMMLNWFKATGVTPTMSAQKADCFMSALALVSAGLGVAFVPSSMQSLPVPDVCFRPLKEGEFPLLEMHCAYLKSNKSHMLECLLKTVIEYRYLTIGEGSHCGRQFS